MKDDIWLEVDKGNGAILSYFLKPPTSPSDKADYIRATQSELLYLNCLEDNVLPPGMIVTLSDLEEHRERVQAIKAEASAAVNASPAPLQTPVKSTSKPNTATPPTTQNKAKDSLIRALRKRQGRK